MNGQHGHGSGVSRSREQTQSGCGRLGPRWSVRCGRHIRRDHARGCGRSTWLGTFETLVDRVGMSDGALVGPPASSRAVGKAAAGAAGMEHANGHPAYLYFVGITTRIRRSDAYTVLIGRAAVWIGDQLRSSNGRCGGRCIRVRPRSAGVGTGTSGERSTEDDGPSAPPTATHVAGQPPRRGIERTRFAGNPSVRVIRVLPFRSASGSTSFAPEGQ